METDFKVGGCVQLKFGEAVQMNVVEVYPLH